MPLYDVPSSVGSESPRNSANTPPTAPPPPNYNNITALQAQQAPTPQWDWPNLTNPEKFDLLRREMDQQREALWAKFYTLQDDFEKHRHAPDGRIMVEYKRQY